ncbi:MAG TPA: VIT and VWA domain-containing protein [Polyangia bacterium]|nr:VIT and VWA domain-containing protein [Polyangia bacterium]
MRALSGNTSVEPNAALPDAKNEGAPKLVAPADDGKTTIEFPLAHTSVLADVTGNIARVEVTQLYQNPSAQRLEAVYQFPLPENAAVTDMMFRIGKRVVVSEVKKRQEARATYEKAKAEGHTAALTEQERPNLFTQSVANIPPGESVEVVIRYVHEVKFDDGRYQFHFPTTIGPRYNPTHGMTDAARVSPPVVAPGVRSAHDIDIVVTLGPSDAFTDVAAKSHRIMTAADPELGKRIVTLGDGDHVPNKDFILSWRPAGKEPEARVLTARDHGDDYLMMFVQPPADVAPEMVRPKEMVFLIDRSGSMWGEPLDTAKAVIVKALEKMGPEDTFQLIAFDSTTESMSPTSLPNTRDNIAAAERWIANLRGGGGTEMLAGIRAALDQSYDPKRLRMVVFCTDGFIGNEKEIIDYISTMRGSSRVFGFGIGSSVNRYLIEGVGRAGRGAAEIVRQGEPPAEAVAQLYKRLDRPVLTDVALRFSGVDVTAMEPERLPDLFAGQPLVVVGKYRGHGPATVEVTGRLGNKPYARTIPIALASQPGDAVLGTLWARRRIETLTDATENGAAVDQQAQIIDLALKFKLITAYTSFVAVEKQLKVDTNIPLAQMLVPNELPEGVSYKGIFAEEVAQANADVTPARVKPGDPEIRVQAPARARVHVTLPWAKRPVRAVWDAPSGEHVARFLVPAGWPDGSWTATVTIDHAAGGRPMIREVRTVELHVDTRAAAVAVVSAPSTVHPGDALELAFKPAIPVDEIVAALRTDSPGGAGDALKSAMDVKEILVRAPWGEVARAKMDGPLGLYRATLHVPRLQARGDAELEVVACDTAGNVSRRPLVVSVASSSAASWAGGMILLIAAFGQLFARRRRSRVTDEVQA